MLVVMQLPEHSLGQRRKTVSTFILLRSIAPSVTTLGNGKRNNMVRSGQI